MKKSLSILLIGLFTLFAVNAAEAANWQKVIDDTTIDIDSIQMSSENPNIYRVWSRDENADKETTPNDYLPYDYCLSLDEYDLKTNTYCVREERFYKKDGTLVESSTFTREESGWDPVTKGTIGEDMMAKMRELVVSQKNQIMARPRY